jgi:MtfA peptidase
MFKSTFNALQTWLPRRWRSAPHINQALWSQVISAYPFLGDLSASEQDKLRYLSGHFLQEKEFHGAHGLVVDDLMALTIAAQACLPLLHMRLPSGRVARAPAELLTWYDDFVGIVVQPGAAIAQREVTDSTGVVHRYREALAGEAMDRGPVMLSWEDVSRAATSAEQGANVVIHEFVHKMDMREMAMGEHPDGMPPLWPGFMDARTGHDAKAYWREIMQAQFDLFRESVSLAERFGSESPWLDDYAATNPAEFFAVTSEAYFVHRTRFSQEFPALLPLFNGFYRSAGSPLPALQA